MRKKRQADTEPEDPDGAPKRRRRVSPLAGAGLSVGLLVVFCLALEFGFRMTLDRKDERTLQGVRDYVLRGIANGFTGNPYTAYRRPPGHNGTINAYGFNDREWVVDKTPGVHRVLCMGGSTTEGGNPAGTEGSYPRQLEELLNKAAEHIGSELRFEVMNAGISGWTTAETTAAYFLLLQDFRPDLVILHHSVNDSEPRNYVDFKPDYSHYRRSWAAEPVGGLTRWLVESSDLYAWLSPYRKRPPTLSEMAVKKPGWKNRLWDGKGLPPETARSFRRNVETISEHARSKGASVMLATMPMDPKIVEEDPEGGRMFRLCTVEHNQIMRELAEQNGYMVADMELACQQHAKNWAHEFIDTVHVTKRGNLMKARRALAILMRDWVPNLE